jgi:putative DNA primase/helicase
MKNFKDRVDRVQSPEQHSIPPELQAHRRFVAWRYEPNGNNKPKKCPINPHTGLKANITDSSTWGSFEDAMRCFYVHNLDGIGFVFTKDDPFAGIDLDDCLDDDGVPADWALDIIERLATYCEVSPSGRGFKLFVRGTLPGGGTKKGQVELYDQDRFFTLTGNKFGSHDVVEARQEQLEDLYRTVNKDQINTEHGDAEPPPGNPVDIPDSLLLQKARENRRTGELFVRLFDHGDTTGYYSPSEADMALMKLLAFWTNRDKAQMIELFGESKLGQREKWKTRKDYREITADKAIKGCPRGYTPDPLEVSTKTKYKIAELRNLAQEVKWLNAGEPNDLFVYLALLEIVGRYGRRESREGWRIIASPRDVAPEAGTTARTVRKSYERLEALGLVSDIEWGAKGKATLLTVHNPMTVSATLNPSHTSHTGGIYSGKNVSPDGRETQASEPPHRVENSMERIEETQISELLRHIRNTSPTTIDDNGKRIACGQAPRVSPIPPGAKLIIYKLSSTGPRTLEELAQELGAGRPDNLARHLPRLLDEGFVVEEGERYRVCDDIEDRLRIELESSNSIESEEYYREQDAQARRAYHEWLREQEESSEEEPKKLSTKTT